MTFLRLCLLFPSVWLYSCCHPVVIRVTRLTAGAPSAGSAGFLALDHTQQNTVFSLLPIGAALLGFPSPISVQIPHG